MRNVCTVICAIGILLKLVTFASGQEAEQQKRLMESLGEQLRSVLKADSVLGTPREFNGLKIIPIVSIGFGLGSGSGRGPTVSGEELGGGIGLGGGGGIGPTGLLVITKEGDVKVIPARRGGLAEVIKAAIPAIIQSLKGGKESAEKENKDKEE
jgi:uncharacterized spore protein YtfJ